MGIHLVKDYILSVDQSKHLQELGLDMSDAVLAWYPPFIYDKDGLPEYLPDAINEYSVSFNEYDPGSIPTYTLQELLEKLPDSLLDEDRYEYKRDLSGNIVKYTDNCIPPLILVKKYGRNLLESAYFTMEWLLENKLLKEE